MLSSLVSLGFLQSSDALASKALSGPALTALMVVWVAIMVLMIAAMWKIFTKAGEPGWAAIVPIYNVLVLLKIAGKPMWWFILFLIPLVNIIVGFLAIVGVAKSFGKGAGFALGLIFLPPIFYPLLAWGDARYQGPAQATATA